MSVNINNYIKIKYEKQISKMCELLGQGSGGIYFLEDLYLLLGAESVQDKAIVQTLLEENFVECGFVEVLDKGKYYINK